MSTLIPAILVLAFMFLILVSVYFFLDQVLQALNKALHALYEVYILRVPVLTTVGVVSFCYVALLGGARPLLGGVFDVGVNWFTIFFVSLTAFFCGWVVMATWRLIRLYGPIRFHNVDALPTREGDNLISLVAYFALILLIALSVIIGATGNFTASPAELSAVSCGFVASLVCMGFVVWVQLYLTRAEIARKDPPDLFLPTKILFFDRVFARARRHSSNRARGWAEGITELVENIPEDVLRGYFGSVQIDTERSRSEENRTVAAILPGHIAASVLLMLTLLAYAVLGAIKYFSLGYSPVVPTLCYILILAMLFCWALSSLTFFLDRYRIPVLMPVAAWLAITSILPWSDYFYPLLSPKDSNDEVALETRSVMVRDEEPYGDSIIVVAANGGGIQAAAWTAQVLTGLEERCRKECDQQFDEKIRLISAVSGGSVGTMYFVNEYEDGRIDPTEKLRNIVKRVEGSSLDEIAWGVLYPDLWHTFIPFPFKWDRGRALEWAWLRQDIPWKGRTGIQKGLSDWRADTQAGDRPAVIFNSTIADSGQRLPLATTDLPKGVPGKVIYDQFVEQIKPKDITIVTAARLSASFPYVSPAARAAGVKGEGSHIVDGGYYDNYGISSLAEWLDQELTDHEEIKKVLIIEIRGAPSSSSSTDDDEKDEDDKTCPPSPTDAPDRTSNQRWFYQLVAPLSTVLNVRKTGQRGHNDVELNLLVDKWDRKGEEEGERRVAITRALFEFDHLHTPLSWHLTAAQKQRIKDNWSEEFDLSYNRCAGWEKVKAFLAKDKANE